MTKTVIVVRGDTPLKDIQDLLKIRPSYTTPSERNTFDLRDPDETQNDIPRKDENPYKARLCEIAGLVNRARTEIADGNRRHALVTLGRAASAIDRVLGE